jgi:hypothetical protein
MILTNRFLSEPLIGIKVFLKGPLMNEGYAGQSKALQS